MVILVYLLYFIASVFIVMGFLMLFSFRRTRRWEFLLLSFVYSASGLSAGYSLKWWPLIAGFVVAWLLKFAGYDPDRPKTGALPSQGSNSDESSGNA